MLFLIPKNAPPQLDSSFSKTFRDFVSCCLQRDPAARPTARELLKHRFVRNAKKTTYLTELIERLERWRAEGGEQHDIDDSHGADDLHEEEEEDNWDFGTIRNPTLRTGGIRQAPPVPVAQPISHHPAGSNGQTAWDLDTSKQAPSAVFSQPSQPHETHGSGRFNSMRSSSSGGSAGGTVRMGLAKQQAPPSAHSRFASDDIMRESHVSQARNATRHGHGRAGTDIGAVYPEHENDNGALASYEAALNADSYKEEEYAMMERQQALFNEMNLGREETSKSANPTYVSQTQQPPLAALDAVFLPILDQLSLAVAQRPDAQRTLNDLRKSIIQAERVTPGLMNAFAVEVYHGMAEMTADLDSPDYDEDQEQQVDPRWPVHS